MKDRSQKKRFEISHKVAEVIGKNWARFSYARHVEPVWLQRNVYYLKIPNLPKAFVGFRIVHLTDFHLCVRVPELLIRKAVQVALSENADCFALTGDFVHAGHRYVSRIAELLEPLSITGHAYAVLGNHDYSVRNKLGVRRYPKLAGEIADALQRHNIQVLHNRADCIEKEGSQIHIAGVADLWSNEDSVSDALGAIDKNEVRILLAHNPNTFSKLNEYRCDLMLSGHTHGGQVRLKALEQFQSKRHRAKLQAGLYYHDSGYLYVNRGVGYTVRWRYKVRPELAVFELQQTNEEL